MEITKELTKVINITYVDGGDRIYFNSSSAVRYVWGAETATTDMRYLHKDDKGLFIYKHKLMERLEILRARRQRVNDAIKVLEELDLRRIRSGGANGKEKNKK